MHGKKPGPAGVGCFIRPSWYRILSCQDPSLRNCMKRRTPALARLTALTLLTACSIGTAFAASAKKESATEPVDFSAQIRPIISSKCFSCHGPDESSRKAKLRLDLRDEALKERKGVRAIVPGDLAASELVSR